MASSELREKLLTAKDAKKGGKGRKKSWQGSFKFQSFKFRVDGATLCVTKRNLLALEKALTAMDAKKGGKGRKEKLARKFQVSEFQVSSGWRDLQASREEIYWLWKRL